MGEKATDSAKKTLNWGILGAGAIARTFAAGLSHSTTGRLVAVGSRSQEKADQFGAEFDVPHRHPSYEALLADRDVQAVYIATPHPMHAEWAIKAAEAGKHLLVEKPIGLNVYEAYAIIEACIEHDVFMMEAFMYRCHPQTARLVELVREKAVGEVKFIQAAFGFRVDFNPDSRLFNNDLGGGGILDVGGYPTSMVRLLAGAAIGKDFDNPSDVKGTGALEPTGVDGVASASLKFPSGIIAQISAAVRCNLENVVRVFGTEGSITVFDPWIPARQGGSVRMLVQKGRNEPLREIVTETTDWLYALEADTVARHLDARQAKSPAMSWDDTIGNMRTLDQWRQSFGLAYEQEKPPHYRRTTIAGRPLRVRDVHNMKYGRIAGVHRPVSRLVMGVDNQISMPHAATMFDAFFERGGNTFDTAYAYRWGESEKLLGQWMAHRGVRDRLNVIIKGAHTPDCYPEALSQQLMISLERQQIDGCDVYVMHRDNPDVPVGEFVQALTEHARAGRIKVFGGSNWSIARFEEANAYARANGLMELTILSNNFSLARMVNPVWRGCIASSDAESRAWLTRTQTPLLAWSSQARGFFVSGVASPEKLGDKLLVNSWYSDDNFERQRRAFELARQRNILPINIALAYVLHQPFPTFALIGPRQPSELRTSLPALDVELSDQEVKWLNLEA